jgi:hypothetical protein
MSINCLFMYVYTYYRLVASICVNLEKLERIFCYLRNQREVEPDCIYFFFFLNVLSPNEGLLLECVLKFLPYEAPFIKIRKNSLLSKKSVRGCTR